MKLVAAIVLLMAAAAVAAPTEENYCATMKIVNAEPSTAPSPYSISAAPALVKGGDIVRVHISGSDTFEGIYLQARRGDEPVGEFVMPSGYTDEVKINDCPPGHRNTYFFFTTKNSPRTMDIYWKAPNIDGEIVFRATFVQFFRDFWVGVESPKITVSARTSTENAFVFPAMKTSRVKIDATITFL